MRPLPSNNSGRRARAALSHPDPEANGFTDQLQRRAEPEGPEHSLQSGNPGTLARRTAVGINSVLRERPKHRLPDHQRASQTVDKTPYFRRAFAKRALPDSCGWILRMAQKRLSEAAVRDCHERRTRVHLCRTLENWKRLSSCTISSIYGGES